MRNNDIAFFNLSYFVMYFYCNWYMVKQICTNKNWAFLQNPLLFYKLENVEDFYKIKCKYSNIL